MEIFITRLLTRNQWKYPSGMKGKLRQLQMKNKQKNTKRICDQQTYLKTIAKGNSLNRKGITKEGILDYQWERKKMERVKIWVNAVKFFFFFF